MSTRGGPGEGGGQRGGCGGFNDGGGRGGRGRGGFNEGGGRGSWLSERGGGHRGGDRGGGQNCKIEWSTNFSISMPKDPVEVKQGWKVEDLSYRLEDQDKVKASMPKMSPGNWGSGKNLNLLTNHWLININPPKELFRYEVDIEAEKKYPQERTNAGGRVFEVINKKLRQKIMQTLLKRVRSDWVSKNAIRLGVISDFSQIVISNKCLPPDVRLNHQIESSDLEDEDDREVLYHVTMSDAAFTIDLARVQELINGHQMMDHPDLTEIKQVYNILMKNLGNENDAYMPLGRSSLIKKSLIPNESNYLGHGMMNWKGASLVCTLGATWKPFLNVDVQNSAFLIGQPVVNAIAEIFTRSWDLKFDAEIRFTEQDMRKAIDVNSWKPYDAENVLSVLKTCKIRRDINGRRLDGRFDGICGFGSDKKGQKTANSIKFEYNKTRLISVAQYFTEVLKKPLKNPNGPVLILGKVFVPAEFCTIKSGQNIGRLLQGNPQRKMLACCTEKPQQKAASIQKTVGDLKLLKNEHKLLNEFGVSLPSNEMFKLPNTRVLPPPNLCYGTDNTGGKEGRGIVTPSDGVWDMWGTSARFYDPASVESWYVVGVGLRNPLDKRIVQDFTELLRVEGAARGMRFPSDANFTDVQFHPRDEHDKCVDSIQKKFQDIKANFKSKHALIICIIPPKPSERYSQIKQASEREGGAEVLTQCVQDKNWLKCDRSVIRNILLKINTKMGGINHVPIYPKVMDYVNILRVPTLILGIDVNHPSLPIQGKPVGYPSFASVTGSLDRSGMPYMMHVQAQIRLADRAIGSAEVVENLDEIVKNFLIAFKNKAKCQPQRIIVFRDGVGDSQFSEVLQKEMLGIRKGCTRVSPTYKPPITFLAVQKRHKVRFFEDQGNGKVGFGNVPPGTVVDKEIVGKADFYLVSHKGMLGTSRPTHYHILWDDSDFSFDELQCLTYFMCYNYARCNRSVSYPAPTYYAHWGATRAKDLAFGYQDWTGTPKCLEDLNKKLQRSHFITEGFPMHFV